MVKYLKKNQWEPRMKKNDLLELKIHDINNLGAGVAKAENGMTVFVNGAVDGDVVSAKIIKLPRTGFCPESRYTGPCI